MLISILKVIIVIGIVTTIHEFGHFISAKLFKMPVKEFSIGFGPKMISKKWRDTIYSIRWLPLGGFVSIVGEAEEVNDEQAFCNKPAWQRLIVVVAGAVFNAILAFVVLYAVGTTSKYIYTNQVSQVASNSIASKIGIEVGDKITKIDKTKINWYIDIDENKISKDRMTIELDRNGKKIVKQVENPKEKWGYVGVNLKTVNGELTNIVELVVPGQAAQYAGILSGDKIIKVNDIDISTNVELVSEVSKHADEEITLLIERNGNIVEKKITPKSRYIFELGVMPILVENPSFAQKVTYAFDATMISMENIINSYAKLFRGQVGVNELSGIVGVVEVVAKSNGFMEFIQLLAYISFSIGIANLMPFPPLDGGKIVLILAEKLTRKKVSVKLETILSIIGMSLLIILAIYVGYNDITRIF